MKKLFYNPNTDEIMSALSGIPREVKFFDGEGIEKKLYFYARHQAFAIQANVPNKKATAEKLYLFNKDTITSIQRKSAGTNHQVILNGEFDLTMDSLNYAPIMTFLEKAEKALVEGWETMPVEKPKSPKGCLKIIGIAIGVIIVLSIIGNMLPEPKKTPLEKFFAENGLGKIEQVKEIKRGDITQMNFEANRIKYGAYVYNEGEKKDEFITIWTDFMPLYSVENNDTVLDETEKAILKNRAYFLEEIYGHLNMTTPNIKADLKKRVKFPKTFSIENVQTYDSGDHFTQVITFSAKNAFGVPMENKASYTIDFKTNKFYLENIY